MLTSHLTRPLTSPLTRAITAAGMSWNPLSLFTASEKGWIYDNNDLTTFYLDAAMTTPATVNGLVGAQRDKSPNGLHRTQATTASKPTLRGSPTGANLFTAYGTPEAGWVDSGGGVGTATATTGNLPTTFTPVSGRTYRLRWTVALSGGTVRFTMGGTTGPTRTASGSFEAYVTASSTAALTFDGVTSFTGTVSAVDVRDVSADVAVAPYGLQFDGVDDFMQTASVDFSATDAVTVCHGIRKLSDAAVGVIVELSATMVSNNGTFHLLGPGTTGGANFRYASKGTSEAGVTTSGHPSPVSAVLTGTSDISSDSLALRINGSAATSAADQGTGNYGSYVVNFGRRNGATSPLNALDYGGICPGRAVTASELASIEGYVANRAGVP